MPEYNFDRRQTLQLRPATNLPDRLPCSENKEKTTLQNTLYYLNAGGLGTRLEPILPKDERLGIAKALVNFGDAPVVAYHLKRALALSYGHIIIGAGHHNTIKEAIHEKFNGSNGRGFEVITQAQQFGTGGDLIQSLRERKSSLPYVVIQNVDTLLDVSEELTVKQHIQSGAGATIILTSRKGVPNEGAFLCDFDNKVTFCGEAAPDLRLPEPVWYANQGSSTGMVVVNTELVMSYPWDKTQGAISLYSRMLASWVRHGLVYGFDNSDRFFMDIGTPINYDKAQRHPILKTILANRINQL